MKTLILVTGQHRSGTSATAGCLAQLGVSLGGHLMPANHANPKGYFEDLRVVELHDALLEALGASWDRPHDVPELPLPVGAANTAAADLYAVLDEFAMVADVFAIKDPRACLFTSLWWEICSKRGIRLVLLIPERLPTAVARSLVAREGWPSGRAAKVFHGYFKALCQIDPDIPRASVPFPDGLWQASTWERIARELDVELDIQGGIGKVHSFLDYGLVHHG